MVDSQSLAVRELALIRGERLLFKSLNFSVSAGQALQIRGPNGCGKTSLLRILGGLIEPDQGDTLLNGKPCRFDAEYYQNLLFLGHSLGIKHRLTVLENLQVYSGLRHQLKSTDLPSAIEAVGLKGYEHQQAAHLSQGQKRRITMARLLIENSSIWILDEPFVALDAQGQAWLKQTIEQHLEQGGLLVFTSHQPVDLDADCQMLDLDRR